MSTTLSQIKNQALEIAAQPADSVYDDGYLTILANETVTDICNEWKWQFLERTILIDGEFIHTLGSDISAGDTTILIEDNTLPDSGAVYIDGEVITYTANDGDTLSGLEVVYDHDEGESVVFVYPAPSDYGRKPNLKMERQSYTYVPAQEFDGNSNIYTWTFVNGPDGTKYILINGITEQRYKLWYQIKPTPMTEDDDTTIIPDEYALSVIPRLMAGTMMIERYDDADGIGQRNLQLGQAQLLKMKKYYGSREESFSKVIKSAYKTNPYN